jgi:hypothetical protein
MELEKNGLHSKLFVLLGRQAIRAAVLVRHDTMTRCLNKIFASHLTADTDSHGDYFQRSASTSFAHLLVELLRKNSPPLLSGHHDH